MNNLKYVTDTCFVLNHSIYKENDILLKVYGKDIGRQTILAKGAQKKNSKFSPFISVANCIEMELVKGKVGYSMTSCTSINSFKTRFDSYESILTCSYICDLVDKQMYSDAIQEGLFELLQQCFSLMNNTNFIEMKLYFEWAFLSMLGYGDRDVKDLPIRLKKRWKCQKFNLIHQSISDEAYVFFRAGSKNHEQFSKMHLSTLASIELSSLFDYEIETHLKVPSKSKNMLNLAIESYFS